jgi:hypothetical protein
VSARPDAAPDVTLTIDGNEITVPAGTLIIRAAERLGIEIPRFCEHPLLSPVGACRQCYVRIEGQPKLNTSCTVPVAPGMVVHTQDTDEVVADAQRANLEFLLLNHPLDCPICDRGGECPLQDQAMEFGPGDSRFREAKRVYRKPIALSPLVALDRERCVLCTRCTRFCDEISGDRFLELFARGAGERVAISAGEDFRSPFSGNTIQICPVGALTSIPYRFAARPFDLTYGDSVCPHCACGCNLRVDQRRGEVVRHLARDEYEVNDAWLCDKGRYAFRFPDSPDRVTYPLLRDRGLEAASYGEVFERIAGWVEGKRVAILTGGRLMDEDAYRVPDQRPRSSARQRRRAGGANGRPGPDVRHVSRRGGGRRDPGGRAGQRTGAADPPPPPAEGGRQGSQDLGRAPAPDASARRRDARARPSGRRGEGARGRRRRGDRGDGGAAGSRRARDRPRGGADRGGRRRAGGGRRDRRALPVRHAARR